MLRSIAHARIPLTYWVDAFHVAVFLINRLPTPVLDNSTPLFRLFKTEPNYKEIQPFGCACYPCLKRYNDHKFDFHSQRCVYHGPAPQHKGYKCLSPTG